MTSARLIEHQITRQLLQRREDELHVRSTHRLIKGLAVLAVATLVGLCLPQLLLPVFLASTVFTLGL